MSVDLPRVRLAAKLMVDSTTYGAVGQIVKHLCDRHPDIRLEVVPVLLPCSHGDITAQTESVLKKYNQQAAPNYTGMSKPSGISTKERVRMVIVDSIASNPG